MQKTIITPHRAQACEMPVKSSNPFQLSHRQLSGNSKGKHEIMLNLPETETQKLVSNIQQGKGFRFNPKKFVRQAKNTLKQVGTTAKRAGKFIVEWRFLNT